MYALQTSANPHPPLLKPHPHKMSPANPPIATRKDDGLGLPSMVVETVSGLTAGLLSTICVHPLDLIKTRLQSTFRPPPRANRIH